MSNIICIHGFSDTSDAAVWDVFVEVSRTEIRSALIGFYDDISKKSIQIGYVVTSI